MVSHLEKIFPTGARRKTTAARQKDRYNIVDINLKKNKLDIFILHHKKVCPGKVIRLNWKRIDTKFIMFIGKSFFEGQGFFLLLEIALFMEGSVVDSFMLTFWSGRGWFGLFTSSLSPHCCFVSFVIILSRTGYCRSIFHTLLVPSLIGMLVVKLGLGGWEHFQYI